MRMVHAAGVLIFGVSTALSAQSSQAKRAFQPTDVYRMTSLASPTISPDGRLVAFTVTTVRERENRRHSEIWVVPTTGGEPRRLSSPTVSSSDPVFSPDGKHLVFTSRRPGISQTRWSVRLDQPGEAAPLTDYPTLGSWPRDGRFAVWTEGETRDTIGDTLRGPDPFRTMQPTARPPHGSVTRPLDPARFDGRHVVDMRYKSNNEGFLPGRREARAWRPSQIWRQSLDGSGKRQLTNTRYSHRHVAVSPDGRWIAFVADAELRPDSLVDMERDSIGRLPYDRERDEAARNDVDVYVMSSDGGAPRKVAEFMGSESNLAWSGDSRRLAFIARTSRTASSRIWTVDASGGAPVDVLGDWRYEPNGVEWLPNGDMLASAAMGGRTSLMRVTPRTRSVTEVVGGRRRVTAQAVDAPRNRIVYVATGVTSPAELYVSDLNGRNERRLTTFHDSLNAQVAWSDAERFTYRSAGDMEIEGWLMKPYGHQPGQRYPMVLYIHGGPHSAYGENWFDEFQNIAAAGMWVLYTNPRGSSGYGGDFTYSTRGRWGDEDYTDLMKAVDLVAVRPDVDSTRMGVTGGSYGGFMTAWITTRTHRFRAAQADRMISNWISWYGVSDAQGLTEFEFYGRPWDNWAMYDSLSPLRFADRVRTPTLIVQSEEDHRTPMAEAEQWFMALQKHGVPVEFIRYPRSTHELSRSGEPWLLVDRLGRLRQWFGHWLGPAEGVTASAP